MIRTDKLTMAELRDDVREFLRSPNPATAQIREKVLEPLKQLGRVYVIGGLIRDLAMYGLDERPESDLDLVVRCRANQLKQYADQVGAQQNRFGGFALRTSAFRVDFWAFAETWAKKARFVSLKTPSDLAKVTFFDWDAVVYGVSEHQIWGINGYLNRLHSGILDINLVENPSGLGTLVRALRRLMMWDAKPSRRLRDYIWQEIGKFAWSEIVMAEQNAFNSSYLTEFGSGLEYLDAVLNRSKFDNRNYDRMRQDKFVDIERLPHQPPPIKQLGSLKFSKVAPRKVKVRRQAGVKDLFAT